MSRAFHAFVFLILILLLSFFPALADNAPLKVETPSLALTEVGFSITITPNSDHFLPLDSLPTPYRIQTEGGTVLGEGTVLLSGPEKGKIKLDDVQLAESGLQKLSIQMGPHQTTTDIRVIPAFLSILPPLFAIAFALITRQVIVALFFGIWIGVTVVYDFNLIAGFFNTFDKYLIRALTDADRIYILTFSLALGGMVGVISKSGGTQGIVERMTRFASNSRGGQVATWLMGLLIFFDDYANTLIVGNTMRPLTDKLRISREKLSYLVDSTAAPVANIALVSSWIGYEISLINDSFIAMGIEQNAYLAFISTIPLNFYPIFALAFGLMIAYSQRDFGPMWHAENRARQTGNVLRADAVPLASLDDPDMIADEHTPKRARLALIPIAVVILTVVIGLLYTGWGSGMEKIAASGEPLSEFRKLSLIIGEANSFSTLMWAAFLGSLVAIIFSIVTRSLKLVAAMNAWVSGIRAMTMAALILTSAWMLGDICSDLSTSYYVLKLTGSFLAPQFIPLIIFITAGVVAFSTGTSWGTMAILMPISIPLAYQAPAMDPTIGPEHAMIILLATTASVLAGATFGDHCSPISDTTIMSSMASGADHIDHVRTQLPYALTCGGVACLLGYIPAGFGVSSVILLPLGLVTLFLVVRLFGKKVDTN